MPLPESPKQWEVDRAAKVIPPGLKAALAKRAGNTSYPQPPNPTPSGRPSLPEGGKAKRPSPTVGVAPMKHAINADVAAYAKDPNHIPTALVVAAVRSLDVLVPKSLEDRAAAITKMYVEGKKYKEIAQALDLDPELVRSEIKKIDTMRQVGAAEAPNVAERVVESHFDVLKESQKAIKFGWEILEAYAKEMMIDHAEKLAAAASDDPDVLKTVYKKGIHSFKLTAFLQGIEILGKQQDRIAEIQGLIGKHAIPQALQDNRQTVNIVQFASSDLNDLATQLILKSGNAVATPRPPLPTLPADATIQDALDVEVIETNDDA